MGRLLAFLLGGLALAAMSAAIVALRPDESLRIAAFYLIFWLPAAAAGLAAGRALALAARRRVRSPAAP